MTKKVLFVATTAKGHINVFHIPYINMFHKIGWEVHVISNGDENVPNTHKQFAVPIERSPFHFNNVKALRKMIVIMKKEKYDLVSCHTPMGVF